MWLFLSVAWMIGWTWAWNHYDQSWMLIVMLAPVGIAFILSRTLWVLPDKPSESKSDE